MDAVDVLHVASHSINIGDGALISGMRRLLGEVADRPIVYHEREIVEFAAGAKFDPTQGIESGCYDLILIGGGGTIDGQPNRIHSGMAFPMSGAQLRRIRPPMAYTALGYNLFPGEKLHCREALVEVLRACADVGIPFSVRNDGSLERIQEAVGKAAECVIEVPDPGFFVELPAVHVVPQFAGRRPAVLLQLAGDNLARRLGEMKPPLRRQWFPRRRSETSPRQAFLQEMAALVRWLIEEFEAEVILAPHITRDLRVIAELVDHLEPHICRPHVRMLGVMHPRQAGYFFAAYANADLVIGMRGHSVICAVGLDTPCLAISTHDKVDGFMRKCGLGQWSISPGQDMGERLRERCRNLLTSPQQYCAARADGTRDFRARLTEFFRSCWNRVAVGRRNLPPSAA